MNKVKNIIVLIFAISILTVLMISCGKGKSVNNIVSPNNILEVKFNLENGQPSYSLTKNGLEIIGKSKLGFEILGKENIFNKYKLEKVEKNSFDETWETVWGENNSIKNNYNEMKISLQSTKNKENGLNIFFKVYDDGIGFRYEVFGKVGDSVIVIAENSEFNLVGKYTSWWIKNDYDSYEHTYHQTDLSDVKAVNTPITMKSKDKGFYVSLHEANLTNYAGMTLVKTEKGLKSVLVPWSDGTKVKSKYPLITPWRTIQISDNAGGLIESNLIINLNEPNKLEDTSWITTGKYVGIWWGMHINKNTWHAGPTHGATTERAKAYIDFSAKHDIAAVLIEGWNVGWESWLSGVNVQDYTEPYDDIDYAEVVKYGKSKNVEIIGHHETGGNVPMYVRQMEDAFDYYEKLGIPAIKTGYAGKMHPEGSYHHGQSNVKHYRDVVKMAADHKIMIDAHEPIKPTGIRRTYPNMMTREGAKGMEYNAWSDGNNPEHTVILPFTRFLGGPMDYTPGIFDLTFDRYKKGYRVYTTIAKQLSYFITLYSPWQMAADLIENYEGNPAFEFIDNVYTDWDETKILDGEIGDYIITARRNGNEWFVGASTDECSREFHIGLDFLKDDTKYVAHIFTDAMTTNWKTLPAEIEIRKYTVTNQDVIHTILSPSGGQAIHFTEYKAGNYPTIDEFNTTAKKRIELYKNISIFGQKETVDHLALGKKNILTSKPENDFGTADVLFDGVRGTIKVSNNWAGFKKNTEIIVDLNELQTITKISVGTMQKLNSWIFPAKSIEFLISEDGEKYHNIGIEKPILDRNMESIIIQDYFVKLDSDKARFVKIIANTFGEIPEWHNGKGTDAWMFIDEIIVK